MVSWSGRAGATPRACRTAARPLAPAGGRCAGPRRDGVRRHGVPAACCVGGVPDLGEIKFSAPDGDDVDTTKGALNLVCPWGPVRGVPVPTRFWSVWPSVGLDVGAGCGTLVSWGGFPPGWFGIRVPRRFGRPDGVVRSSGRSAGGRCPPWLRSRFWGRAWVAGVVLSRFGRGGGSGAVFPPGGVSLRGRSLWRSSPCPPRGPLVRAC